VGDCGGRKDGVFPEAGEKKRMPGDVDSGAENVVGEVEPAGGEGLHERAPGGAVGIKALGGGWEVLIEETGGAVVERMGERGGGVDPLEAVALERQRGEEGRADAERVDGRTDIVAEAREGELHGAAAAADGGLSFVDIDPEASLREYDGGGETVGAGADDGSVLDVIWHMVRVVPGAG
jgi:hypothetical protein